MNILFLTRLYKPHIGGVEKHVETISHYLAEKGHHITIITEQHDKDLKVYEKNFSTSSKSNFIKIYRIPTYGITESQKKWRIWQWLWQHKSLISQADIIHIHDVFFWFLPFRFLFPLKKTFITFHGWETHFPPSKSAIIQKKLAATLTKANICVGKYIPKWYGINPTLISYGATDQRPQTFPQNPSILVFGRLSQDNDTDKIIQSLKIIKKKHSNIPIIFLGSGPLKNKAQKLGHVITATTNITPHLKKASLVIASSYLSILDALATHRPVISIYSNPLKRDYLTNSPLARHIQITKKSTELTQVISKLLAKPAKICPATQKWIKNQTWQKLASRYLKLWQI